MHWRKCSKRSPPKRSMMLYKTDLNERCNWKFPSSPPKKPSNFCRCWREWELVKFSVQHQIWKVFRKPQNFNSTMPFKKPKSRSTKKVQQQQLRHHYSHSVPLDQQNQQSSIATILSFTWSTIKIQEQSYSQESTEVLTRIKTIKFTVKVSDFVVCWEDVDILRKLFEWPAAKVICKASGNVTKCLNYLSTISAFVFMYLVPATTQKTRIFIVNKL